MARGLLGKPLPCLYAIHAVEQVRSLERCRKPGSSLEEGEAYEDGRRSPGDTGAGPAYVSSSEVRRRSGRHPLRAIGMDGAGAVPGEGETTRLTPICIGVWPDAGRLVRWSVPRGRAQWSVENRIAGRGERPEHARGGREEPRPEEGRRGQEG